MTLFLQSVRVANGVDEEGVLVFDEGHRLVAVLVRLSNLHGDVQGQWYLEAGFGHFDGGPQAPVFSTLDDAQDWIAGRVHRPAALG